MSLCKDRIALIGLGNMGTAIGEKLLEGKFNLTVYNRTLNKCDHLVNLGANQASSIREAVQDSDIVISSLFDDQAVIDTTNEIVKSFKRCGIHISTSTIRPNTAKQMTILHEKHGSYYIGAAVLGVPNTLRAKEGTTLAAGSDELIKICEPIFKSYSSKIINLGTEAYKSNVMKTCSNYLLATAMECMGELYTFAEKNNLESEHINNLIHNVFLNKSFLLYADKIKNRDFSTVNFSLAGGYKDIKVFEEAFLDSSVIPELIAPIKNKLMIALANGYNDKDWSAITEITRLHSGLK